MKVYRRASVRGLTGGVRAGDAGAEPEEPLEESDKVEVRGAEHPK